MASGSDTLFAFLSTGCLTCQTFWDGLQPGVRQPLPGGARVIVVVKDPAFESPRSSRDAGAARRPGDPVLAGVGGLRGRDVAVLLLRRRRDRRGAIGGRRDDWEQVASLLRDALLDEDRARDRAGTMNAIVRRGASAVAVVAGLRSTWSP